MLTDEELKRLETERDALKAELARLKAPGGWRELMARDAYRFLGDPTRGVGVTTAGGVAYLDEQRLAAAPELEKP